MDAGPGKFNLGVKERMCKMETWLLEDYAEGILGVAETTLLEAHLQVCADCRQELTRIKLLFWELESIRREAIEVPAVMASMETAILEEWLQNKESWMRHAGAQIRATARRAGMQVGTAVRQTSDIVSQIPGAQASAELIGKTSRKTAKWIGKTLSRQIWKGLSTKQETVSSKAKSHNAVLTNLIGGGG